MTVFSSQNDLLNKIGELGSQVESLQHEVGRLREVARRLFAAMDDAKLEISRIGEDPEAP